MTPIIKWVGGKRQLLPIIKPLLPAAFNRYYEPFLGGGAVFCDVEPQLAVINDRNQHLINMYRQVKDHPLDVCMILHNMQERYNSKKTIEEKDKLYYKFRDEFNRCADTPRAAALLIFLNKAGFNGLYRVSSLGVYNVPSAHKQIVNIYNKENVLSLSNLLSRTKILCEDFEAACSGAAENDFVFFDSPYYGTFDQYQAGRFTEKDHIRLYNLFEQLTNKGVYCMLTNSNCAYIKKLYSKFHVRTVNVKRLVNRTVDKEVIVTNYRSLS